MTKDEALNLALEALKQIDEAMPFPVAKLAQAAIKEALSKNEFKPDWDEKLALTEEVIRLSKHIEELEAQPIVSVEQSTECGEPVAWVLLDRWKTGKDWPDDCFSALPIDGWTPLYTHPPQRTWVGLTDEDIDKIYEAHHNQYGECESVNFGYERAIEDKLRSKNT